MCNWIYLPLFDTIFKWFLRLHSDVKTSQHLILDYRPTNLQAKIICKIYEILNSQNYDKCGTSILIAVACDKITGSNFRITARLNCLLSLIKTKASLDCLFIKILWSGTTEWLMTGTWMLLLKKGKWMCRSESLQMLRSCQPNLLFPTPHDFNSRKLFYDFRARELKFLSRFLFFF